MDEHSSPAAASRAVYVCAHGAGGHKDDRSMLRAAAALQPAGLRVVRFNFPYRENWSRRIDPMDVLKASFQQTVRQERRADEKLVIGGRSMGGRVASMLAAEGYSCDGLLLLAYPLHPAGKPDKLRDAHLAALRCPVLCVNGTRDPLCRRELMEATLARLGSNWTMHWIEGADHSFNVLKSSGRAAADVGAELGEAARSWLGREIGV